MCPNLSTVKFPCGPNMLTDTPPRWSRQVGGRAFTRIYTICPHRAAFPLATAL